MSTGNGDDQSRAADPRSLTEREGVIDVKGNALRSALDLSLQEAQIYKEIARLLIAHGNRPSEYLQTQLDALEEVARRLRARIAEMTAPARRLPQVDPLGEDAETDAP